MPERIIGWRKADDLGLKAERVLDTRIASHHRGKTFYIEEFVVYDNGDCGWRRRMILRYGIPFPEKYKSLAEAEAGLRRSAEIQALVDAALAEISQRDLPVPERSELVSMSYSPSMTVALLVSTWKQKVAARRSAELEARKEREREERLQRDTDFLIEKAQEMAAANGIVAPAREDMRVTVFFDRLPEGILDRIATEHARYPYLRHVATETGTGVRLWVSADGRSWREWDNRYEKWARKRQIAERARIADAFGEDPAGHWGQLKARLLKRFKPEALDLLHRKDIQDRLTRARSEGVRFVVFGPFGFAWNEAVGEWEQRAFDRPDASTSGGPGSRLWREGPIVSNNHGRIIVLPFTKADGTNVEGYTRNGPNEGRAEPRAVPVEIPFLVYDELGKDETWDYRGNVHIA